MAREKLPASDSETQLDAMRESETQYRLLFESNPHPMWVHDAETLAFLTVNEKALKQYGYSREEFLSMTLKDIRPPEEIPRLLEDLSILGPDIQFTGVRHHRRKDGSIIEVEIHSSEMTFRNRR
ncbi:MAG TPA: PAS domain S-box protein, partial [Blastocatellia bacterium]|nr:PAS domain S-box protein [Blastocatellia bacterium]